MAVSLQSLISLLGLPVGVLLTEEPFRGCQFERSVESDIHEITYVFPRIPFEVLCDEDDNVSTIFCNADDNTGSSDLPLLLTRDEVLRLFGQPSKSGRPFSLAVLGDFGAWDRFVVEGHTVHVEFFRDRDSAKCLTLMRADVTPP